MEVLDVTEQGDGVLVAPGVPVERLMEINALDILPHPGGGFVIKARNVVGVVRAGNTQVHIRPKVGVARLLWLLGYARNTNGWLGEAIHLDTDDDLLTTTAHAFVRSVKQALAAGLLQNYRTVEEALPSLRGRFHEAAHMSAGKGLPLPIFCRYDDYTADIPENQVLVSAIDRLLRIGALSQSLAAELQRLAGDLVGVGPLRDYRMIPIRWDRRNQRYRPAVALAELILAGSSLEAQQGLVQGSAFAFDMNTVFEDFLSAALGRALAAQGGATERQVTLLSLDREGNVAIRPDLIWRKPSGPVVVDAKYKTGDRSNADVYQLLAYCTAYGATCGHIVDAADGSLAGNVVSVRRSAVRIFRWHLDLGLPPAELLLQVEDLASRMSLS